MPLGGKEKGDCAEKEEVRLYITEEGTVRLNQPEEGVTLLEGRKKKQVLEHLKNS